MFKSSLSNLLMLLFSVFVVIESFFIGVLCYDILRAEHAAKREFNAVKLSQELYQGIYAFAECLEALSELRYSRTDPGVIEKSDKSQKSFIQLMDRLIPRLRAIGEEESTLHKMRQTTLNTFELYGSYDSIANSPEKKLKKKAAIKQLGNCYTMFTQQLRHVQKLLAKPRVQPLFGIEPAALLQIGAVLNIVYLACLVAFLERCISRPLTELTERCDLIRARQALPETKPLASEIGVLQQSFHEMSKQVVENENRRMSYIFLLQNLQLKALNKLRKHLVALSKSSGLPEKASARTNRTLNSIATLENILQSMTEQLEISNPDQVAPKLAACSSKTLLAETAGAVESLLQARTIKLEFEGEDQEFKAAPQQISRVLLNLISNAIKYSPDAGTVKVWVSAEGKFVKFSVKDSGPGISEEGQRQLFKRFSQVEALDGVKRAGTGLGLVICREFVEAHNGEIGCISNPGAGSCFWFKLPRQQESVNVETKVEDAEPRKTKTGEDQVSKPPATSKGLKQKNSSLERKSLKSIKINFSVLIAFFITSQVLLFFILNGLLAESAERSAFYAKQKSYLLKNEELFTEWVRWGNMMQLAAMNYDLIRIKTGMPNLVLQKESLARFLENLDPKSTLYGQLYSTNNTQHELLNHLDYALEHISDIQQTPGEVKDAIEEMIHKVENSFKAALATQTAGFQSSYSFSKEIRTKILLVLVIAAVTDLLLISFTAYMGLKLVGKILILKSKTETFAVGGSISASLSGSDELCFLDQNLCAAANEIKEAESKRQELLAVINHDLRTPLSSVLGTLENLNLGTFGTLTEADARLAKLSLREVETLLQQINDLLLLEKLESGTYVLERTELLLSDLMADLVKNSAAICQDKGVSVSVQSEDSKLAVYADKALFLKSIAILLTNAIEASANGMTITVALGSLEKEVILIISDTGNGITQDLIPQIFNRFRFVNGIPIAGFGLPLAAKSCDLEGGSIRVLASTPGRTDIELRMPACSRN